MADVFDQVSPGAAPSGDIFDQLGPEQSFGAALREYGHKMNPVAMAQGFNENLAHPVEALKRWGQVNNKILSNAEDAYKRGDYTEAAAHALHYVLNGIPGLGESLDDAGTKIKNGDLAGGLADTAALGTQLAVGSKLPAIAEGTARGVSAAGTYLPAAAKAAAPDVMAGATKIGAGELVAKLPGAEWPARILLDYPGAKQVIKGFEKGHVAGKAALAARNAPSAVEAAAPVEAAAATPGQALAESEGQNWDKLSTQQQQTYEAVARTTQPMPATEPPKAYAPRPPEYYGVKTAEVPPTNPAPSAPAPTEPASAAAPATTETVETPPPKPAENVIPFKAVRKTGPQDALEGVGGGVGPGFTVYKVPTEKLVPSEDISGMPEKMADVSKYTEKLKAGSEPPALFGHYDPDTGNVVVTSGSRRMMAAQQAGASDVPVAIPKAAPGAEETLGIKPEPPQPKPASGATAAKSARYADAIAAWAKDMGMSPKAIADQWGTTTPEVRGQIILQLKQKGYLGANETIPRTSAQGIVDALKAKAATIKPPAGFGMGSMKQYPPEAASPAPSAIDSKAAIEQNGAMTPETANPLPEQPKVSLFKTEDGREFPQYEGKPLSWHAEMTSSDASAGFPKAKAVLRAMRDYRPQQFASEYRQALRGSFDKIFGPNARKYLNLIEQIRDEANTARQ